MNSIRAFFTVLVFTVVVAGFVRADDPAPPTPPPTPADPPAVTVPAPTLTVTMRKELASVHPRIFINAAGVEAFKKKIADPTFAPMWTSYLASAAKIAAEVPPATPKPTEDPFRGFGDRLPKLAFAYLITRDPQYLAGARAWIQAVMHYPSWAGDEDLAAGHLSFGLALAYDWLYDSLEPQERQDIEKTLLRHGRILMARSMKGTNSWWGSAYFQNHCWINHTGIAVAAMAIYETNPKEMQDWLDYTRTCYQPTYTDLGVDGGYHEGPAYARYGTTWMIYYTEALRSISGEDLGNSVFLRGATNYFIYSMMPDGRDLANFGDSPTIGWGPIDEQILPWLAARFKDGHAEWLRQKNRAALGLTKYDSPFAMLWFDPSIVAKPPDDLPTTGVYPDLGLVISRTSWKDDAAVVSFKCGSPSGAHIVDNWEKLPHPAATFGHSHPDANSFLFWSDGQWRIGAPGAYTHMKVTHNENVWLVGGKGQRGEAMWFDPTSYFVPGVAQPHLVRVASGPAADYIVGEAAPGYEAECQLTSFRRRLLFVKGASPYVVVYDRLQAAAPTTWESCLHTFGPIDVADKAFQSVDDLAVVEPTKISGPQPPTFTPTFGTVLGPTGTTLTTQPLNVVTHEHNKPEDRGFELLVQPPGNTAATWLITVVGAEKQDVTMTGTDAEPKIKVGSDKIAWDAQGHVSLNGKAIAGNLLPTP